MSTKSFSRGGKTFIFKEDDMLELTPQNVTNIGRACMTVGPNAENFCFAKKGSTFGSLYFPFDPSKLKSNKEKLRFMLGQLLAVHNNTPQLKFSEASQKFNGRGLNGKNMGIPWTSNNPDLMLLFTMAHACALIPQFYDITEPEHNTVIGLGCDIFNLGELVPTEYSPTKNIKDQQFERD